MKEFPLTQGFDLTKPLIGKVVLNDGISASFDQVISLGGIVKRSHSEGGHTVIDEFELLHFALIPDGQFARAKDVL